MAARDAGAFLTETLASLDAQSLRAFEFVAVDDGSTDDTSAILTGYAAKADDPRPVVLRRTAGLGLAAARNIGTAAAGGDLVLLLDGDDVLAPSLIEAMRTRMMADPSLGFAYPVFEHVDADTAPLGPRSRPPGAPLTPARILKANPVHSDSGVMVRASALGEAGPFDEALTGCIGLDYWMRVLGTGRQAACVPGARVLYRRSGAQITADPQRMSANFAHVLTKAREAGLVSPREAREALAAQRLYWASLAYARGEDAAARAFTRAAWRGAPRAMARTPYAYARGAISAASLLPAPLHRGLRRAAFGLARRAGTGGRVVTDGSQGT